MKDDSFSFIILWVFRATFWSLASSGTLFIVCDQCLNYAKLIDLINMGGGWKILPHSYKSQDTSPFALFRIREESYSILLVSMNWRFSNRSWRTDLKVCVPWDVLIYFWKRMRKWNRWDRLTPNSIPNVNDLWALSWCNFPSD